MSVVIDKPQIGTQVRPGFKSQLRTKRKVERPSRPVNDMPSSTHASTATATATRTGTRTSLTVAGVVAAKAAMFGGVFLLTCVVSGISGRYLASRAYYSSQAAVQRTNQAIRDARTAQHEIDVMTTSSAVEQWALSNGFHSPDGLGQTSKVDNVASPAK